MKIIKPSALRPRLSLLVFLVSGSLAFAAEAQHKITISADHPGASVSRQMWGIFFEDINFGADGGLYAELIKNRSFEFQEPLMGWTKLSPSLALGTLTVRTNEPVYTNNPSYLRIQSDANPPFGVSNEGFRGIGVRKGESYNFSAQIRKVAGSPTVLVRLYGADGTILDAATFKDFGPGWKNHTVALRPNDTDPKAWLAVLVEGKGTADFDMVSLFPQNTWKNRPRGLRSDMVQTLADLHPGFLRFPGGCIVEGSNLDRRYRWKETLGPAEERKGIVNRWNYEFLHRPTPDYYQSFGLGFFEYFQLAEDLGAAPLPILNCGMACQFNTGELCPMDDLGEFITDALDLIEFANGPATSPWGSRRAAMGHREPFKLKMLGIGNEQWGPQYVERYKAFADVLKAKHPEILLVSSAGPAPADDRFHFLWSSLRGLKADIVDEHCYANPIWFLTNSSRYDNYERNGPKVFFGEYAAQSSGIANPKNLNTLECALAEAAFMTGLERNADVVRMASYAPLFGHVDAWQWTPNMIWVDNLRICPTANYYVQQMFSANAGDFLLPLKTEASSEPGKVLAFYASAVLDDRAGEIILKVVNPHQAGVISQIELIGVQSIGNPATITVLSGDSLADVNSLQNPRKIAPVQRSVQLAGPRFTQEFPARSLSVLRIKTAQK